MVWLFSVGLFLCCSVSCKQSVQLQTHIPTYQYIPTSIRKKIFYLSHFCQRLFENEQVQDGGAGNSSRYQTCVLPLSRNSPPPPYACSHPGLFTGVSRLDDQIFINRNPGVPSVVKFHPFNTCIAVADKDSIWSETENAHSVWKAASALRPLCKRFTFIRDGFKSKTGQMDN